MPSGTGILASLSRPSPQQLWPVCSQAGRPPSISRRSHPDVSDHRACLIKWSGVRRGRTLRLVRTCGGSSAAASDGVSRYGTDNNRRDPARAGSFGNKGHRKSAGSRESATRDQLPSGTQTGPLASCTVFHAIPLDLPIMGSLIYWPSPKQRPAMCGRKGRVGGP